MQLRVGWRYLVAFAALTILCGTSHEFAHHFAGALVCGEFGSKTFNSFTLAPGCGSSAWRAWPTIAGPLFTFALMWLGAVRLRNPDERQRQLGFALVFANFPINRMGFVLFGWNDEQWVARHEFGASPVAFWLAVAAVWIACLPPLIAAWRAIENRRRALWFAGFFVLPFVFVVLFAGGFLEEFVLLRQRILADTVFGVPWLIIAVEFLSLAVYLSLRGAIAEAANDADVHAGAALAVRH